MYVDMKKASIRLLIGGFVIALLGRNLANAAAKTEVVQFNNKFDFYLLATQWIPGWCEVGSGQSGAIIDNLRACQQQSFERATILLIFHRQIFKAL